MDIKLTQKQFAALSHDVFTALKKENWLQRNGMEIVSLLLRLLGICAGFFIFMIQGIFFKIIGMIIMSYFYTGIVVTVTHGSSHGTFFKSKKLNAFVTYFSSDFLVSQSSAWWYKRHVELHHAHTNIVGKDPPLFVYPWMNKYVYFFLVPYLIQLWFYRNSISYLWGKWKELTLYLLFSTIGWIAQIYLFVQIVSLPSAILCVLFTRLFFAPVFAHIAIFNHVALEEPIKRPHWLPHQTKTTRNLKKNWFITGIGGNAFVDGHIEHHLFPSLSHRMLDKVKPIIVKHLKKEGYVYLEEGYFECLSRCLRDYDIIFVATNNNLGYF